MLRTVPANLQTHLEQSVTTLAFLWKITRVDSTVFYFTDSDKDIIYDGHTWLSTNSGELSTLKQQSKLSVGNFDFRFFLDSNQISKDDLIVGLFDFADVAIYLINKESVSDGVISLISGKLGEAKIDDNLIAIIEFRSLTQLMQNEYGKVYTHECDADLGDTRCAIALGPYTVAGTLDGVTDNMEFADSLRSEADAYFNYGLLTWTGGNNNGLSMEVKNFTNATGTFLLTSPMHFTVQSGDTYSVYRGCNKTRTACRDVFSNLVKFRGFPDVPGYDKIIQVPDINPDAGLHE